MDQRLVGVLLSDRVERPNERERPGALVCSRSLPRFLLWLRPCLSLTARYQGALWESLAEGAPLCVSEPLPHGSHPVLRSHSSSPGGTPRPFLNGSSGDLLEIRSHGMNSTTFTLAVTMDCKQAKTTCLCGVTVVFRLTHN